MSKQQIRREQLEIEIDNKIYIGHRIITGNRIQYQTIHYEDVSKKDSTQYTKDRTNIMNYKAQQILGELVREYHKF